MLDKADIDRVVVTAAHELLRTIERVDEEISRAMGRDAPCSHLLFGDHWNAGRGAGEAGKNDQFRGSIRLGYWRRIALGLDFKTAPNDVQDRLTRFARCVGNLLD